MRSIVAHVYRLVAADLRPSTLQEDSSLRVKIVDWIIDTLKYLQAGIAGTCVQALQLIYNVSNVSCTGSAFARETTPSVRQTHVR